MTPPVARCLACNYPLHGISSTHCPECGRAFNPDHPMTMNLIGRPIGAVERFVLRPRLWPINVLGLAATAWTLWLYRWPDDVIRHTRWRDAHVAAMWWGLFVLWAGLMALMFRSINRPGRRVPKALYRQGPARWVVFPLIAASAGWLTAHQAGFNVLWRLSRPAADTWVRGVLSAELKFTYADRGVGSFWAKQISTDGRRVGFDLTDDAGAWCLIRVPPGDELEHSGLNYWRELGDGWHLARRDPTRPANNPRIDLLNELARDRAKALRSMKTLVASLADDLTRPAPNSYETFYDADIGVRREAEKPRLLRRTGPPDPSQRLRPDVRALINAGRDGVPYLAWSLSNPDPNVRLRIAGVLGEVGPAAAVAAPALAKALGDAEYPVREATAYALGEIGRDAVAAAAPALGAALCDPMPCVRYNAALALRKMNAPPADRLKDVIAALGTTNQPLAGAPPITVIVRCAKRDIDWNKAEAIRDMNAFTTAELIEYVAPLGPDAAAAVPQLIAALRQEPTRAAAMGVLAKIGPPATAGLLAIADGPDLAQAADAIRALGRTSDPAVVDALIRWFKGDDGPRAAAAADALAECGPAVTPRLVAFLHDAGRQLRTAEILARSDPARADLYAPMIIESMTDSRARETEGARWGGPFVISPSATTAVKYAYPHLGPPAIPYLARAFSDRSRALCVLNTLERIGAPAIPALTELLRSDDWTGTCRACELLAKFGPAARAALPQLCVLLEDANPLVRGAAVDAIAEIGADDAAALKLELMRSDPSERVRLGAAKALSGRRVER